MPKILDANVIIRYLVEDNEERANAIERLLKSDEELVLTDVTISEIVWVLSSYYENTRQEIVEKISSLVQLPSIKCGRRVVLVALGLFQKFNIDWVDAYLAAYAGENGFSEIYSYDRDLDKVKKIKRLEPRTISLPQSKSIW